MGKYNPLDHFDISSRQYHAGLDKLWAAMGITTAQKEDVFTLVVSELTTLKESYDELAGNFTVIEHELARKDELLRETVELFKDFLHCSEPPSVVNLELFRKLFQEVVKMMEGKP